jgi:hypothetical protein
MLNTKCCEDFSDADKNPPNPVLYMILSMPLEPNAKTRFFFTLLCGASAPTPSLAMDMLHLCSFLWCLS